MPAGNLVHYKCIHTDYRLRDAPVRAPNKLNGPILEPFTRNSCPLQRAALLATLHAPMLVTVDLFRLCVQR